MARNIWKFLFYLFDNVSSIYVYVYLTDKKYLKNFVIFIRQNVIDLSLKLVKWQQISGNFCYIYLATFHQFMCVCISPRKNIWEFCYIYSTNIFQVFCHVSQPKKNIWKFLLYMFSKMLSIFLSCQLTDEKYLKIFVLIIRQKCQFFCYVSWMARNIWKFLFYLFDNVSSIYVYAYLTNKKYLKNFVILIRQNVIDLSLKLVECHEISGNFCYIYLAIFHQFVCVCISLRKKYMRIFLYLTKFLNFSVLLVNRWKIS